ncbi:MAG: App1 family protein [Desulfovibrionales bacterium]
MKSWTGRLGPLSVIPYRGYGTKDMIELRGRVVEDKPFQAARETDTSLDDLRNMYRRFTRMPIPGEEVQAIFRGQERKGLTDPTGYFHVRFSPLAHVHELWHGVSLHLRNNPSIRAEGQVLIPPENAGHAIISDIDDTVLPTHATNFIRMMKSIYTGSSRTRLPFPGVGAFYRALHLGPDGEPLSPLFYVSRGPWNLFELLSEFFQLHDIPIGPILFLRDWGLSREGLAPAAPRGHKFALITSLIRAYDFLPFILIGDSGQKDPEIYTEVIREHPGRVKAVYIREVTNDPERIEAIHKLALELGRFGSPLVLARDSIEMGRHAAGKGWIEQRHLDEIRGEKAASEEPPSLLETVAPK